MTIKSALAFAEFLKVCEEENEDVLEHLKFNPKDLEEFSILLDTFISVNQSSDAPTNLKGKSLEDLVEFIFSKSYIFDIHKNVRTSTNEIDLLVRLNTKGVTFNKAGYISIEKYLLCECKNYNKTVGVTWTGKFYSLLNTSNKDIGIIFSYHGLSGKKWGSSSGLIRKIHLSTSGKCKILSFSLPDFELLRQGVSFARIIEQKIEELENDTSYFSNIVTHELENENPFKKYY